jgi:hypothetical protein
MASATLLLHDRHRRRRVAGAILISALFALLARDLFSLRPRRETLRIAVRLSLRSQGGEWVDSGGSMRRD